MPLSIRLPDKEVQIQGSQPWFEGGETGRWEGSVVQITRVNSQPVLVSFPCMRFLSNLRPPHTLMEGGCKKMLKLSGGELFKGGQNLVEGGCLREVKVYFKAAVKKRSKHWRIWGRGREGRVSSPGPKFIHFHAIFGKNWLNNRLAPPCVVGAPFWEILDPPLQSLVKGGCF